MNVEWEPYRRPGRRALVTGGAVRVGRAISLALGRAGYDVAVHYHSSRSEAAETVRDLKRFETASFAVRADLGVPEQIDELFRTLDQHWDGVDLLVNGAAIFPRTPPLEVETEGWDRLFALNTRGPFQCSQHAARRMPEGSSIVNIADTGADEAWPAYVPYVASKAALVSLTRGLARAWAPRIRVNAVAPGPVLLPEDGTAPEDEREAAERTALGRVGSPEDVAGAVLYLDNAPYVTGVVLRVDGGHHLK